MTDDKMNAPLSKKTILPLVSCLVLAVGGCAGAFDPQTDEASPLAPRIQHLVDSQTRYPRWEDFPKTPTDTHSPAYVAGKVQALAVANETVARLVSAMDWTLDTDPAVFEAQVRQSFDHTAMGPIGPQTTTEIEAFAEQLRQRASPPPPIDRPR